MGLHKWEYLSRDPQSRRWMVGNSQMKGFGGDRDYQITFKRGGKILEILDEANWLTTVGATHIVIDGLQNSVKELITGRVKFGRDILPKMTEMNKKCKVVLAETIYCPEHREIFGRIHWINREVRKVNREASGLVGPQPWKALSQLKRPASRKMKAHVKIIDGSFAKDGYHISSNKIAEFEEVLAEFLTEM